jgi:quinol-cytochrome oxidoreductase complex cytochrome b subunit
VRVFAATWSAATLLLAIAIGLGQRTFDGTALGLLVVALVPTGALIRWLGLPTAPREPTRRVTYALVTLGAVITLVAFYLVLGRPGALVPIGAAAAVIAWRVRARLAAGDARFALAFGAIAAVAGLGAQWVGTTPCYGLGCSFR